jgi:hypothetical protein
VKILVLGGGWYGCHLAAAFKADGHAVELHEAGHRLFSGASGANPARLHLGFHYPRSKLTRAACQAQHAEFMKVYGHLTRAIPLNLYAIACETSHVDFGNYVQTLRGELEFITVETPGDFGLQNIEGAILTGERHIVIREAREYFQALLGDIVRLNSNAPYSLDPSDVVIDCTFCAMDAANIDRYEPCVTVILEGPTDRALTIMDGPFPSVYPWDERDHLLSLTSAAHTPLARVKTYHEARSIIAAAEASEIRARQQRMIDDIAHFWPDAAALFRPVDALLAIRAMPASGADARLVDIVRLGPRTFRVRAGKIVSIFHAENLLREALCSL